MSLGLALLEVSVDTVGLIDRLLFWSNGLSAGADLPPAFASTLFRSFFVENIACGTELGGLAKDGGIALYG